MLLDSTLRSIEIVLGGAVTLNQLPFVVAYAEWTIVDKDGRDCDKGEYVYIRSLWIHSSFRGYILSHLIGKIYKVARFHKNCKYVYWQSRKHGFRLSKTILISRFKIK